MDQVDNIIFENFISLGWEKEEDVRSLKDLEVSTVAALLVKCLNAINNENDLPQSLPYNMSQRFRAAAKIAEMIQELGYSGDIGYQSILYSSEVELRKIFTFLIEKLPKDSPVLAKEPVGKLQFIHREAARKLDDTLKRPWVPPHCAAVARKYKASSNKSDDLPLIQYGISHSRSFVSDWNTNCELNVLFHGDLCEKAAEYNEMSIDLKCPSEKLFSTLLNFHSEQLGSSVAEKFDSEKFEHFAETKKEMRNKSCSSSTRLKDSDLFNAFRRNAVENPCTDRTCVDGNNSQGDYGTQAFIEDASTDQLLKAKEENREKEISSLSHKIAKAQEKLQKLAKICQEREDSLILHEETLKEEENNLIKEEKRIALIRKTSSLMSDPEGNVQRLKESIQASKGKEKKLLEQWLEYKTPLEKDLQETKLKMENKMSKQNKMKTDLIELKKNVESLIEEAKIKETLIPQLQEQKNKLGKGANRAVYTKQILDISAKVQKQKQEINKILADTRVIQKEINTLTGKLQRTFAVVEDASFRAANSNERARPIYRSVVTIHEEFGALVDLTREIGVIQREIADLQQQLSSEKSKNIEDNLKKLQEDFNNLKTENVSLKQELMMT